jgi:hypothetical protein
MNINEFDKGIILSALFGQITKIGIQCEEKSALGEDTELLLYAIDEIINVIKKVKMNE